MQKDDGKPTPLEDIIRNEEAMLVKQKIDGLPEIQKDAIILYYYHDMKVKDIAKIMDIKLSTAKSRLKQGRDKLKYYLVRSTTFKSSIAWVCQRT